MVVGGLLHVGVGVPEVLPNVFCTAQWRNLLDGQRSSNLAAGEYQFLAPQGGDQPRHPRRPNQPPR